MKTITFSRVFPSYHPRAGEPTHFIEKLWSSFGIEDNVAGLAYTRFLKLNENNQADANLVYHSLTEPFNFSGKKFHTIRGGKRWKVGDKFSPRVWSGKPYRSKQVILATDIEIKKVWNFELLHDISDNSPSIKIDGHFMTQEIYLPLIAKNDGLTLEDILEWFQYPKPFSGQIISWSENIEY